MRKRKVVTDDLGKALMRDVLGYYLPPCPVCRQCNLHWSDVSEHAICSSEGHRFSRFELTEKGLI